MPKKTFGQDSSKEEDGHNNNRNKNSLHKSGNRKGGGHGGIRFIKQGYDPLTGQLHEVVIYRKKQRSRKSRKKFGSAAAAQHRKLAHLYDPNGIEEPDSSSVVVDNNDGNREQEDKASESECEILIDKSFVWNEKDLYAPPNILTTLGQQQTNQSSHHHDEGHSNTLLEILIGTKLDNTGATPVSAAAVLNNNSGGASIYQNAEQNLKPIKMESELFSSYRNYHKHHQINYNKDDASSVVESSLQSIETISNSNIGNWTVDKIGDLSLLETQKVTKVTSSFTPVKTEIDSTTSYTNEEISGSGVGGIDDSYIYENEETGEIIVYKPKPQKYPRTNENQSSLSLNLPNTEEIKENKKNSRRARAKQRKSRKKRFYIEHVTDSEDGEENEVLNDYIENTATADLEYLKNISSSHELEEKIRSININGDEEEEDSDTIKTEEKDNISKKGKKSRKSFRHDDEFIPDKHEIGYDSWDDYYVDDIKILLDDDEIEGPLYKKRGNKKRGNQKQRGVISGGFMADSYDMIPVSGSLKSRLNRKKNSEGGRKKGKGQRQEPYVELLGIHKTILNFIKDDTIKSFHFQPYASAARRWIHLISKQYNLKSESTGADTRIPPDQSSIDKLVNRGRMQLANVCTNLSKEEKEKLKNKIRPTAMLKHGTVVGASAAPLTSDNIGHRMLSKMGWKEGTTLGQNGGISQPLETIIRLKRTGLGLPV
ncbi:7037_t:CDS:10 [Ambispora gerdemannii]|uniref:7037_t:CDS:1 n=1 Tax=Ambispora gerdemannii TaxID=144530 RepID=A0A9N9ADM1_9GLOM|nr:7037_t:CDS:10 [Ambispora gerdemannii]